MESKEGSEVDASLGAKDAEPVVLSASTSSPPVSVPQEMPRPTSPLSPDQVMNHEVPSSTLALTESNEATDINASPDLPHDQASPIEELDEIKDTPIVSNAVQEIKTSTLKYNYKEDQWSPLNPEGKKQYDREFLLNMQSQPMSLKKPTNLPNSEVIKEKPHVYKLSDTNQASIAPIQIRIFDPFMPSYGRSGPPRPPPHGISRRSQQGCDNRPKKGISFSNSLDKNVKLHKASNPWVPQVIKPTTYGEDTNNQELYKKVRGILNKLTLQKFDTLIKQVKDLEINTEERLQSVVELVFKHAIQKLNFSIIYARMCKQLALLRVPFAEYEGYVNFRHLLLTKCQKEFEKDSRDELKRVEKLKLIEDATDVKKKKLTEEFEEEERQNRRRQLGNIRFMGELFKFGMLTEMIMHECISKLFRQGDEDSLEFLCCLLTTIGKELETRKEKMSQEEFNSKKAIVNGYMNEIQITVDKRQTSSRIRFMLQDVIDLRKNMWKPRRNDYPKTIDQIRQEAEREAHEQQQLLENMPFSNKRLPDNRKMNTGQNPSNFEQCVYWITTNKTSKVNYSVDALKLQFKDAEPVAPSAPTPVAVSAPTPSPPVSVSVPEEIPCPTSPLSPAPVTNHEVTDSTPAPTESNEATDINVKPEVPNDQASPVEEPEEIKDAPIVSDAVQEIKTSTLKYNYKEDQWSPLNSEGKKHYDREFLLNMQSQPMSLKKPTNLPNLEVIKEKAQVYKLTDMNRAPIAPIKTRIFDPFMPSYAHSGPPRPPPHGISRRSQQGRGDNKPKKGISFSNSLNETVKLHEASNASKPQMIKPTTDKEDAKNQEVYKKVRGILNKLTPQKFDTLVKQVKDLEINTEERLPTVVDLVFKHATQKLNFSIMYASMCKQLALLRVPFAEQEGYVNFRKLLLTKYQKEFEQDSRDELKRVEKMKLIEEALDEKKKQLTEEFDEEERKNRRRQLGNIRFIGELFKFGMLTEMIMHECILKLLRQGDEDSLECLCCLLTTIGKELETRKEKMSQDEFNAKKAIMNGYMNEMQKIVDKRQTSSRVRFMLQDVIDLKKNMWKPRRNDDNPKTIDQIHQEAKREAHEQQQLLQNMPFSNKRPPDDRKRNTGRNPSNYEQDGWITTNKTSEVNYSVDALKLQFKPAQSDTIQLGPVKGFFNWGRGISVPTKSTPETEKAASILSNRYSALADHQMPAQQSYDDRRNIQRSAASSQQSSRGRNNQLPPQSLCKTPSTSKERENALEAVSRFTRSGQPEPKPVEPKVPNVTSVNGKGAAATSLKGPELSEEDIEKKTKALMDKFVHNGDFKEAVSCITELASPTTIHYVITAAVSHVLERSSQARYLLGQLLHNLVQSKLIVLEQYNKGLASVLELVDDYALDIPLIWDYLAEVIEPMLEGNDISMSFLEDTLRPCSPSSTAGKLIAAILHCASKKRGTIKVREMWRESGLRWSSFLPPKNDVSEFLKAHDVEFTVSQAIVQPVTVEVPSAAEILKKLGFYLKKDSQNNEQIFDWIESHIGANTGGPTFIRALVTSIFENAISGSAEKCELNTDKLKIRMPIIQHYVAHKDEPELQTLYALQALVLRLNQPKGILNEIFDTLYEEEVISEETFDKWETSRDPAEQEGKGVAVNSVSSFFTWLREAEDNESSVEDG